MLPRKIAVAGVAAVASIRHYGQLVREMRSFGGPSAEFRQVLAADAFGAVAAYYAEIAAYLNQVGGKTFPQRLAMVLEKVEDLSPLRVLAAMELRYELETSSSTRVPLDCDVKRAFAINEASEVGIQPFLLIVRTDRIFTAHTAHPTKG